MATENPFVKLFAIDFKDHLEVKKSGNTELKYVKLGVCLGGGKKAVSFCQLRGQEIQRPTLCL